MALPNEEFLARLVSIGFMPSEAQEIADRADALGDDLPTPAQIEEHARVSDADIDRLKQWWWYTPDVPQQYRRLLGARRRNG